MSNKPPDDKDGLLELIKKLWLPIAGFIGAVTLAYNFYKLWLGDQATLTYIITGAGLIILILTLGWVGFKTKTIEVDSVIQLDSQTTIKRKITQPAYSLKYRRTAWAVLSIVFAGIVFGMYSLSQHRQAMRIHQETQATLHAKATQTQAGQDALATQQISQTQQVQATQSAQATQQTHDEMKKKLIVVIASFEGPEEVYGLRNEILENLISAFHDDDQIEVVTVNDIITLDMGSSYARELGEKLVADIVIWGWYRPTENPNINIHLENLSPTEIKTLQKSETYEPQATLAQLESFEIQKQLGSETNTLISFLVGTLKYEAGDYRSAKERFEQVISQNEISTFVNRFDLFFNLGNSNRELDEYETAIQNYDKAIEINPQEATVYFNRGLTYEDLGQFERAIQDYDKAIETNPKAAIAYYGRGLIYGSTLQKYNKAIEDFSHAIEIDPSYSYAYIGRGNSYSYLKEYENAIQDFGKAIEINPQYELSYANRAGIYTIIGKYGNAIQDCLKAIEINAQYKASYLICGNAYFKLNQYDSAIESFTNAIKIDANYVEAYSNRGLTYATLGQKDQAILDFSMAIQLDPQYANSYYGRGWVYHSFGRLSEAEADFKKYEELTGKKP